MFYYPIGFSVVQWSAAPCFRWLLRGHNDRGLKEQSQNRVVVVTLMVAFFSLASILEGEKSSTIHPTPAFFFFFFEVEISSRTLIPLFRPGSVHSGSTS